ncbi:Crp/Fnr family transcriptional regulator [Nocardioides guangzhouensis]|uniref:Crp/Fnr family transcriptional regulator n=1 Tax=Nocardioides guangzhouensis TaxID=2497878 RepID=A0A4Q4Z400_9ACTN|nr:Crp/Fnr family transcriptional regulator [Nocardioides guangzhouensis]RYP81985.1 Crp/Fnr family transcriptional regulator [Nocardioides guangzhouensis]
MDPRVESALGLSNLRDLPQQALEPILDRAVEVTLPAGSVSTREGELVRHIDLLMTGAVRLFVVAPDGRTMTVRYCRAGAIIGAVSLFAPEYSTPVTTQALVDSGLLKLHAAAVIRAASADVRVANAFLRELGERVMGFIYEIPGSAFTTVRQRVARHLLDLCLGLDQPPRLHRPEGRVVRQSQHDLADAVGTTREVVVRVLRELRAEGIIQTGRERIVITDPVRLAREVEWNTSS